MLHLRKVPYIEQMQQTECGLCCIAMILRYYKSNDTLHNIRKELDAGRDGLRLSHLQGYLVERGFESKLYRVDASQLTTLPLPAIAFWDKKHFVVIEHYSGKKVQIVDPAYGRLTMSFSEFEENYSGIIMTATPTSSFHRRKTKLNPWGTIITGLKEKKGLLIRTLLISIIAYSVQMLIPLLIQVIVDGLIKDPTSIELENCAIFTISLLTISGVMSFLQQFSLINFQIAIDKCITKNTFHKLIHLPYSYFENRSNGDLLFRLSSLEVIRNLLSNHIISGVIQTGYAIAILIYMFNKSILLTTVTAGIFLLNGIFILVMRNKIMEANQIQIVENTKLQSIQTETIYSIFGIKTSGIEEDIWNSWNKKFIRNQKAYSQKGTILNVYSTIISLFQMAGPLCILLLGVQQTLLHQMSVGEIIACYSLSGSFIGTSLSLFNLWNDYIMTSTYLDRLQDITQEDSEKVAIYQIPLALNGNIEFRNVSFSYTKSSEPIINDLSFKVEKGSKFAIVGPSGSGKSTITKLLLGLYEPTEGDIFYEGINLKFLDKNELRKQIGVVPQDMSLFNKPIAENIALSKDSYDIDKVMNAAKIAQVHDEIMSMPMNYRTLVSDMGGNLSGGQRQRIVLARALMNNPRIMILDEATSSLDNVNEKKVSEYLRATGNTQIIIAHRMSTIVDADKILVLDKGKKVECGTHNDLIDKNGIYAHLYRSRNNISA